MQITINVSVQIDEVPKVHFAKIDPVVQAAIEQVWNSYPRKSDQSPTVEGELPEDDK